jgi:glutamate dehydrogenase/leucine dehydrogenase
VVVIPDILASAGGSIAVEALYSGTPADGQAVLAHVSHRIAALVQQTLDSSRTMGLTPRDAAMRNAARCGDDDSNGATGG